MAGIPSSTAPAPAEKSMHATSRLKMEAFLKVYAGDSKGKTVLDVGSRGVNQGVYTYKASTDRYGLAYTGLDFEAGYNVDLVPANPYIWTELKDEQFDLVISGQAFEHNPFMWVTFCEIARVLKKGGIAFVIAPSSGNVHRYPYDCWRYYPDSWATLCALTGLDLTESMRETPATKAIKGNHWIDSAVVATKPALEAPETSDRFYSNLAEITAPFKARRYDVKPAVVNEGQCFKQYLAMARVRIRKQLRQDKEKASVAQSA
jgi:SAM-dependent methyltransferase